MCNYAKLLKPIRLISRCILLIIKNVSVVITLAGRGVWCVCVLYTFLCVFNCVHWELQFGSATESPNNQAPGRTDVSHRYSTGLGCPPTQKHARAHLCSLSLSLQRIRARVYSHFFRACLPGAYVFVFIQLSLPYFLSSFQCNLLLFIFTPKVHSSSTASGLVQKM